MEQYVLFDNLYNTFKDFKLYIQKISISEATVKEEIIDIPGADGCLDFSESLTGDVKFNNRVIRIELLNKKGFNYLQEYSRIQNALHGKRMKVRLSEDLGFYYIGRVTVKEYVTEDLVKNIAIEIDADAYKYDITASCEDWLWDPFNFEDGIINETKDLTVNGELTVNIYGRRKLVSPKFVCQNALQCIFERQTYNFTPGTNYAPNIQIREGKNTLKFIGKGTVSIEYRGGSL